LTYGAGGSPDSSLDKRGVGVGAQSSVNVDTPPYEINNGASIVYSAHLRIHPQRIGNGRLSIHAVATNATHAGGYAELDTHNLWGLMEEKATYHAITELKPGKRPFLISRSTFPSSGKWSGHWVRSCQPVIHVRQLRFVIQLGDNYSKWQYLYFNIQGVLQFQIFQIPMVGADTCGFNDNTDEELCNRWMSLSAFVPFYRNHNIKGAISQEPYRWDSVADASRTAIATRYAMLPYWVSRLLQDRCFTN
jgi:alpha-glucosidase